MPALPPVANVFKIVVSGLSGAVLDLVWNNVFHASWAGATPTTAIANAIAESLYNNWFEGILANIQTEDTSLESVEIIDLTTDSGASGLSTSESFGSNGEDPLPAQVCTLISVDQARRYRGGHPRYYLNAGGDGNLASMNQWNTGYLDEAQTQVDSWFGDTGLHGASSGGCALTGPVCVSYVDKALNPVPPYRRTDPLVEPIIVDSWIVDEQIATQRRRVGRS
jgi:hypothetical protein